MGCTSAKQEGQQPDAKPGAQQQPDAKPGESREERSAKVRALVKEFDSDGDGLLSKQDVSAVFPGSQVDEVLGYFNVELKDGKVRVETFLALLWAHEIVTKVAGSMETGKDGLPRPLIMAHRGACGYNPPHTIESYLDAVNMGADYIEFDIISTKDHHLILNHDVTLESETDVKSKFPDRMGIEHIRSAIDGDARDMTGYFAKDFTLAEVKTLEKIEYLAYRTISASRAEKLVQRPLTAAEAAQKLEDLRAAGRRNFGIIVELKRPKWHRDVLKLPLEEKTIEALSTFKGPVNIQCFEPEALQMLRKLKPEWTYTRLLVDRGTLSKVGSDVSQGAPEDPAEFPAFYGAIAKYAEWVSPWKGSIVQDPSQPSQAATKVVEVCHGLGLEVNCYTFRSDVKFKHPAYGGNSSQEFVQFFNLGLDAVFTDFTDHGVHARNMWTLMKEVTPSARTAVTDIFRTSRLEAHISKELKKGKDGLPRPLIMAHRGACGYNTPHSWEGYCEAVNMGADYIEFDVIATKDHHLVTNHDLTLESETDVALKFPDRKGRERIAGAVDGDPLDMTGYFAKDFTLAEVLTLEKVETWAVRTISAEQAKKLVQRPQVVNEAAAKLEELRISGGREFGLVVELKRPGWHRDVLGLPLEEKVIEALACFKGPVNIQCFEPEPLQKIRKLKPEWTYTRLLVDRGTLASVGSDVNEGVPEDPAQFREFFGKIAQYADWVSPWKGSIVSDPDRPPPRSELIDVCHELGLEVNTYTFRTDVQFLHQAYGGNPTEEFGRFFTLGVDAVFTDFADHGVHARNVWTMLRKESARARELLQLPNPLMNLLGSSALNLRTERTQQLVAHPDNRKR